MKSPLRSAIFLVALAMLAAPWLVSQSEVPPDDVSRESVRFAQVYAAVESNYVDAADPDQLILEGGVRGMLSSLDPFSSFFNADQFQMLQQQARGQSLGFGSILYVQAGKVVVLESAEKSPAWRAGLAPGDEIVSINGTRIDTLDFNSLVDLLRRARSQPVTLGVIHPGKYVSEDVRLVPAQVNLPTVDKDFLLSPGIGYLHVSGFEQKTPQEIAESITRLGGDRLKGVLLDLRDNHGGIVDAAVATASLFMKPDLVLLTVRGRSAPQQSFRTMAVPAHFEMPLIVLVNQETASAAEIAAAAFEEYDRGLVVGEPTFGKGVVDSLMPLSDHCGLALITAQYFTSSGRSIQRPLPGTALAGEMQASLKAGTPSPSISPAFRTEKGRPVAAGDGITPDVLIPARQLDPWVAFLNQRGLFSSFAAEYLTLHGRIESTFQPDESTLETFKEFLARADIRSPKEFWESDQDYLKLRIKIEISNLTQGLRAGDEVEVRGDPQVQKAAKFFSKIPLLLKAPGREASPTARLNSSMQ